MKLGEICILTHDVVRLANFYKSLLETGNGSNDAVHQTILEEETMLTIFNDGQEEGRTGQNMCLAFTVDDIDKEYQKVLSLGAEMIEPPTPRPWGAVNMSFAD
ncbi:MAG: VOC family protein, partial [Oscillospiraceae bacterium]|nr:VOC family protein [Oscillospiraceae bacterium]